MKIIDIIKTSSSNLWRNKGRTFLTVIAVFIGAFTLSLTIAVSSGVNDYIDRQLSIYGDDSFVYITKKSNSGNKSGPEEYTEGSREERVGDYSISMLNKNDVEKIETIKHLKNASIYNTVSPDYIQYENSKKYKTITYYIDEGQNIKLDYRLGAEPKNIDEIAISRDFLEALKFKSEKSAIGQNVKLQVTNAVTRKEKIYNLKVVGILEKSLLQNSTTIITPELNKNMYNYITEGLNPESKNTGITVTAKIDGEKTEDRLAEIKKEADDKGYIVTTAKDQVQKVYNVVNAISGALIIFGAIALLAASFGIINTLYMSVRERTREIGLMKAMGLSNKSIFILFSMEAVLIGLIGSIIGLLCAMAVGSVLNTFAINNFLKGLEGFNLTKFTLTNNLILVTIIAFIAFLAGALPSRSASKKDPIESLRYE